MHLPPQLKQWTLDEVHSLPDDGNKYELVSLAASQHVCGIRARCSPCGNRECNCRDDGYSDDGCGDRDRVACARHIGE